jgi:hypothetical protein
MELDKDEPVVGVVPNKTGRGARPVLPDAERQIIGYAIQSPFRRLASM